MFSAWLPLPQPPSDKAVRAMRRGMRIGGSAKTCEILWAKREAAGSTGSPLKCQRLRKRRRRNYIALLVVAAGAFATGAFISGAFISGAFISGAFISVPRFSSTFIVLLAFSLLLQAETARAAPATR